MTQSNASKPHSPALIRATLAAAIALAVTPLAAQPPTVVSGAKQPVYQELVSFADLDLRQESAQRELLHRVREAANRVCTKAEGRFLNRISGLSMEPTCTQVTHRAARPQIAAVIERARLAERPSASPLAIAVQATAR